MPDLPANLPTNWTLNMIVSPNGTEAGLGEEYGYNYLMEQVNAAQQGVNSNQEAITELQADLAEAGGFVEFTDDPGTRTAKTLYAQILADYTGGGN